MKGENKQPNQGRAVKRAVLSCQKFPLNEPEIKFSFFIFELPVV